jgi:hypothetical protein
LEAYTKDITDPIAGCTVAISRPEKADGSTVRSALSIRQYEVYNPGPATLSPPELKILLSDKYKDERNPPNGLCVEPVGSVKISYSSARDGDWTICSVVPWHTDKADSVSVDGRFGVVFLAFKPDWKPDDTGTVLCQSGGRTIPASQMMPLPRKAESPHRLVIIAVLLSGYIFVFLYALYLRQAIPARARLAAEVARAEIESQAQTQAAKDMAEMKEMMRKIETNLPKKPPRKKKQ